MPTWLPDDPIDAGPTAEWGAAEPGAAPLATRREVLAGGAGLAAATLVGCAGGKALPPQPSEPPLEATAPSKRFRVFHPNSRATVLALADVIVPRDGDDPAATEIDLLPRLERYIASRPERRLGYRRYWRYLEARIRKEVPFGEDGPEPAALLALCESLHAERVPRGNRAKVSPMVFEQLRKDVLSVYYASPAGWATVGYTGPPVREHPHQEHSG